MESAEFLIQNIPLWLAVVLILIQKPTVKLKTTGKEPETYKKSSAPSKVNFPKLSVEKGAPFFMIAFLSFLLKSVQTVQEPE
jgi:hypothetical protein